MKHSWYSRMSCCLVALIALAAFSATSALAFSSGGYRGKTNRGAAVKFRVSETKVSSFSIRARYRCTDGDRFSVTENGFASIQIENDRFSENFTGFRRAGSWRISGQLAGRFSSGTFRGKRRYNRNNRLHRRGSVVCRTGTVRFNATGPAPAAPPTINPPATEQGTAGVRELSCSGLPGAGSYNNPLVIGNVTGNTIVLSCPPLTSGAGFNLTWFSFSLTSPAPAGAEVASLYQLAPDAISAVHPRLATSGGYTLITSTSGGRWIGDPNWSSGRALPIDGLPAGSYRLGMEKLDSPLRSLTTPPYHVAIAFD